MNQNDYKENFLYHYKMKVDRVIDGDTFVGTLDLGFKTFKKDVHVRLLRINAPELRAKDPEEKRRAYAAQSYLHELINDKEVIVQSIETDAFGRILANVYIGYDCINDTMLNLKLARKFEE